MNATIQFTCPQCSHTMQLPSATVGKQGKCPDCKQVVTIEPDPRQPAQAQPAQPDEHVVSEVNVAAGLPLESQPAGRGKKETLIYAAIGFTCVFVLFLVLLAFTGGGNQPSPEESPGNTPNTVNLTACPDCGGKVSNRAAECPHCGAAVRQRPKEVHYWPGPDVIDPDAPGEFTESASGLKYRILRLGSGRRPDAGSEIRVLYEGWLDDKDKTVFGSSYELGLSQVCFVDQVLAGWVEGVQYIGEGGMIELTIPPELAYGEEGSPPNIPPNATLHFRIELLKVE